MMRLRVPMALVRLTVTCGLGVGLLACDGADVNRYQSAVQKQTMQTAVSQAAATVAPLCSPTGAHAAHQGWIFQCTTCHPCGGVIEISSQTLSDGFAINGTVTRATDSAGNPISGSSTCTVSCHGNQPVSWNSSGLGCASCHGQWNGTSGMVSTHGIDPTKGLDGNAAVCTNCHTSANHFDPTMGLVNANDSTSVLVSAATVQQVTTFCQSCHDGSGKTFAGSGPPIGALENHRTHLGSGFGGSIKAPYQPGQGSIDCIACHQPHGSSNPFMFAATVNGNPIAPGSITRAGVGAEPLCMSCHLGDKHSGCKQSSCHDGVSVIRGSAMNNEPVPSNGPCFYCHDHAGIIRFDMPTWDNHPTGVGNNYCYHCHTSWYPRSLTTTPPSVTGILAGNLTTTTADVTWTTSTLADSWVEYGTTDVTNVTGSRTLVTSHKVTLTGLSAGVTYKLRVRTNDAMHNLAEAPAQPLSFTTPLTDPGSGGGSTEPAPTGLVAYNDSLFPNEVADVASPVAVTFQWAKVTSPSGSTRYAVQVSTSSAFTTLVASATSLTATSVVLSIPVSAWWPDMTTYYWRVQAIDASTSTTSAWANGQFTGYLYFY